MAVGTPERVIDELVRQGKRVVIAMQHSAKGKSKLVRQCTLLLISARPIDLLHHITRCRSPEHKVSTKATTSLKWRVRGQTSAARELIWNSAEEADYRSKS